MNESGDQGSTRGGVRAVIFDFGGVFIDSPFKALEQAAVDRGFSPEELTLAVFGAYDEDTDHPWHRLERGEVTVADAREEIMANHVLPDGTPLDPFELLAALAGGGVREDMVAFCRELRSRGLGTSLLTNNAREFEEFWKPLLPLEELFDDVVDSSEVGMRKPAPEIFHLALDRLGLGSEDVLFVDDAPGNVAGAQAVGIRSVLVGPTREELPAAIAAVEAHLG
ncbi:MAG: HAD family hydrolase [Microthrixaceae bacterium]